MRKILAIICFLSFSIMGCQPTPTATLQPTVTIGSHGLWLSSTAFNNGESIPTQYACRDDQPGVSPALTWGNLPSGTKSLSLIVEDPDAPFGIFTHWVVYNIPPEINELPQGMPVKNRVVGIGTQGKTSFGANGYGGPCPPFGQTHHYYLRLYALDLSTSLEAGLDAAQLRSKIESHILAQAEWMGIYKQP